MTNPAVPPLPTEAHGTPFPPGAVGRLLFWIAVAFSLFQIATAAHVVDMASQIMRALHVGFLTLLAFPLVAYARSASPGGPRTRLGARRRGPGGRVLPMVGIRAADPARGPAAAARRGRGDRAARHRVPRVLGDDGGGAADHRGRVPGLLPLRGVPARAAQPPRLRLRAGRRPHDLRDRGRLRHPDLRLVHVHLPLHPVRLVPRARGHDPALHRRRHGHVRRQAGRRRQGRGRLLGADGDDLGLGRGQRRDHRTVHDPADEALRLPAGLRGRRRIHRLDGRAADAAGDGRGRLHHGRDARHPLRRRGPRGADPGRALLPLGVLDRPSRGGQVRAARPAAGRAALRPRRAARELGPAPAAGRARLPAVRRLHAALRGHGRARAHRAPDPRRLGGAEPARGRVPHGVLGRARPRRGRVLPMGHRGAARGHRGAPRVVRAHAGRARDARALPRQPGRGGQDRAAGGDRLRGGGHHHRHDDPDRGGQHVRSVHRVGRASRACSCRCCSRC